MIELAWQMLHAKRKVQCRVVGECQIELITLTSGTGDDSIVSQLGQVIGNVD